MQLKQKIISGLAIASAGTLAAAIAIPAFSCGGPPRAEAEDLVGSITRAQQDYYTQNQAFASSIDKLDVGIPKATNSYKYSTRATKNAAYSYGVAKRDRLNSYVSAIFIVADGSASKKSADEGAKIVTIMCASNSPSKTQPAEPIYQDGAASCGANTSETYAY